MNKSITFLLFIASLCAQNSFADYRQAYLCLASGETKNILMTTLDEKNAAIDFNPLMYYPYLKEIEISSGGGVGFGDEHTDMVMNDNYDEIINGKITGQYQTVSRNHRIVSVIYFNKRNNKTISFSTPLTAKQKAEINSKLKSTDYYCK